MKEEERGLWYARTYGSIAKVVGRVDVRARGDERRHTVHMSLVTRTV